MQDELAVSYNARREESVQKTTNKSHSERHANSMTEHRSQLNELPEVKRNRLSNRINNIVLDSSPKCKIETHESTLT
jgi:hypothetical protein